jgi:hypothetical protein
MSLRTLAFCAVVLAGTAHAADAAKNKKSTGQHMEKLDLGLGNFGDLPKGTDLKKSEPKKEQDSPSVMPSSATYTVVKVTHGKSFNRGPNGATAAQPFDAVPLSPSMVTDKFSTVVRVKCPQKLNASIEVAIYDPRGDTAMSAPPSTLYFRGNKTDEVEWTIDWEPTTVRGPGTFQFKVTVNGQDIGSFPLKFEQAAPPPAKK